MEACIESGLLVHDGRTVAFRHELARQVIDASITPARRSRFHRRILAGLVEAGNADAAICAHHAEQAGDAGAVLRFAPLAARRAATLGSHQEAVAQYERALRFAGGLPAGDRASLLDAYATELLVVDRSLDALEVSADALACWRESGDLGGLGRSLCSRASVLSRAGDRGASLAAATSAIAVLEPLGDCRELARRTKPQRDFTWSKGAMRSAFVSAGSASGSPSKRAMRRRVSICSSRWAALA